MDDAHAHAAETDWASAWAAALDELELTLDETERLLRGDAPEPGTTAAPWAPPPLEGPMPVDLRTRALELHHRQQRLLLATAEATAALRRQAELTARMTPTRAPSAPVYLDVTA